MKVSTIELSFTAAGDSAACRKSGWSGAEPHGTWTCDNTVELVIRGLDKTSDYTITTDVVPFLWPGFVESQSVSVSVGGTAIFAKVLTETTTLVIPLNRAAIEGDTVLLTIYLPDAAVPRVLGMSNDSRKLGIWVSKLSVSPGSQALPVQTAAVELLRRRRVSPDKAPVAAVTMVHNEKEYLPIWIAHYIKQVGAENCYIVDHGSTDGSTHDVGQCNILRIPRSSYDPEVQSDFTSKFCSSLLLWYHYVCFSDVDEIVMPDPNAAANLVEFVGRELPDISHVVGLNVIHRSDHEAALHLDQPITLQRSFVLPTSSMCKASLIARDVKWSAGSHTADAAVSFNGLYMFHLRWFDLQQGLLKLARTRAWADEVTGTHQRLSDSAFETQLASFARTPVNETCDFDLASAPLRPFIDRVVHSQVGREYEPYKIDLYISGDKLWKLPKRFVGAF